MPRLRKPSRPATPAPFNLTNYLDSRIRSINQALHHSLPQARVRPATIHQAMRYSLFAGGKRMRPVLCLAAAEACGGGIEPGLPLACAVECLHTYSLIHDDLPAMDNDDFRRGKPTNHKVFGEGIAILAGDALLTQAFELAARWKGSPRYPAAGVVLELAVAGGSRELIAGQVADLEAEGKRLSVRDLKYIHERKTSALLCCSVRLGAMSADASPAQLRALTLFGNRVGLAFQIIDDILDVTQTSAHLGKTAGKDVHAKKATYPSILGLEKARRLARRLTREAFEAIAGFSGDADPLRGLASFLLERSN